MRTAEIDTIVARIVAARRDADPQRAVLVAVSGIDGSGKGYVAARLVSLLEKAGLKSVALNVDGWLNLPERRFSAVEPAEHFYGHALRLDAMFATLVLPLRDTRAVCIDVDHADETATSYRSKRYEHADVDVVVVEGIYLLKRAFVGYYDLSVWVDCTFETALERAVARAQEGLPPSATIEAYRRIYFPAQRIHFARDEPSTKATITLVNDPRLDGARA